MRLRTGRHEVTVRPAQVEFVMGKEKKTYGEPITYRVNVQPVSTTEREALGLAVEAVYRIKYWPQAHSNVPWAGGPYSRITWQGKEFDQQGEAMLSSMSARTGHVKILMSARGVEVK